MDPKQLSKAWQEPDGSVLSKRQIAVRLPLHVLAKVDAVSVLFPEKSKTEIIGDLLSAALDQFAEGLSTIEPPDASEDESESSVNRMRRMTTIDQTLAQAPHALRSQR